MTRGQWQGEAQPKASRMQGEVKPQANRATGRFTYQFSSTK